MQLNLYHRWAEIEINAKNIKITILLLTTLVRKQQYHNPQKYFNMLLNLIVSLVRIKLESNNFKLCSANL